MTERETKIARRVVRMLEREGWEVYKEVLCPRGKLVCDIFAVKRSAAGAILDSWAIETKAAFGLAVMEQAHQWQRYAHRSSIGVPRNKKRRARAFGYKLCTLLGLGIVEVTKGGARVHVLGRRNDNPLLPTLVEAQKLSVAGSADRSHWTPFKDTAERLVRFVEANPGVSLEEAVAGIEHHYKHDRSAYTSLKKHIQEGVIPELKLVWRRQVPHLHKR